MDESQILARFIQAREFEVTLKGGWKFKLRLPTDFQERRFAIETSAVAEAGRAEQWSRSMVIAAVIGWTGPTLDDLLHEGDRTPLPFSPSLVGPLIDSNIDEFDELTAALYSERKQRIEKSEAAVKNSVSVSNGS